MGNTWTNRAASDLDDRPGSLSFVGGYASSWELYSLPAPIERQMFVQPLCRGVSLASSSKAGGTVVCGSEVATISEQRVRRQGRVVTTTDTVLAVGDRELMRIEGRAHEHDPSETIRAD